MTTYLRCPHAGCTHSASSLSHLRVHERMHLDERPFHCPHADCRYAARTKYNLQTHIRAKHTKERPFACEQCLFSFSHRSNLTAHVKKVHVKQELPQATPIPPPT